MPETAADHALLLLPVLLPVCLQCGHAAHRIPRLNQDRARTVSIRARRYRCAAPTCDWQGLLLPADLAPAAEAAGSATNIDATPASNRPLRWARNAMLGSTVAAAIALPVVVAAVVGLGAVAGPSGALALAPGVSHDGLALRKPARPARPQGGQLLRAQSAGVPAFVATAAAAAALSANAKTTDPLMLRQGCAWGQPGRNPYRGTTEQALQAAHLPDDVVRQVSAMRLAKQTTARLQISTTGIREVGGPREFAPRGLALSFGNTLCLDSKVNFAPGHTEPADLYEVRDSQGRLHAVMVPDVCGNVSVLQRRGQRGVVAGLAGALAQRSVAMAALADALAQDGAGAADTADSVAGGDGGGDSATGAATDPASSAPAAGGPGATSSAGSTPGRAAAAGSGSGSGSGAEAEPGGASTSGTSTSGTSRSGPSSTAMSGVIAAPSVLLAAPGGFTVASLAGVTDLVLPRGVAVAGVGSLAGGLAKTAELVASVAVVLGDTAAPLPVTGLPAGADRQAVPEPGTLACVLAGLAALGLLRRRQRR